MTNTSRYAEHQMMQCLEELTRAAAAGNTRSVRRCAERLRTIGTRWRRTELIELAQELEESGKHCNLGTTLDCVETLRWLSLGVPALPR